MQELLQKCYTGKPETLIQEILNTYTQQGFCIINFLYYAQIKAQHLFEPTKKTHNTQDLYAKMLKKGDFLLPDGMALQLLYRYLTTFKFISSPTNKLPNLNGTDFTPFFLQKLSETYGKEEIGVLCYGAKPTALKKACNYLQKKGIEVIYAQEGYSVFNWEAAQNALSQHPKKIFILLQGRSTPKIPLQELWTRDNYEKIKKNQLILMNVGGLFDRRAGTQKRAPLRVRKIKCERARRLASDPKRNFQKCLNTLY